MQRQDLEKIVQILTDSFRDNHSTQFVVKQDGRKEERLKNLIRYALFRGQINGEILLTPDEKAAYILLDSEKNKTSLRSVLWDIRLIVQCIGISNVSRVLKREKLIKNHHPSTPFVHLWYIGVDPAFQGLGHGTALMKQLLEKAKQANKPIYLETSTPQNFSFYENLGFQLHAELEELGYSLKMYKS